MQLPNGLAVKCLTSVQAKAYIRMLQEEILELEQVLGVEDLPSILAETADVFYLALKSDSGMRSGKGHRGNSDHAT